MNSYFPHDSNARNSDKLLSLRISLGAEGYGIYFMLLERLREAPSYMSVKDYNMLAFDFRVGSDKVKRVVEDFGLFVFTEDGKYFYSEGFRARMEVKDMKSEKARESALKRWRSGGGEDANAMQTQCERNANGCKNDAIKEKKSKVNNNTPYNPPEGEMPPKEKDVSEESEKPKTPSTETGTGSAGNTPPSSAAPPSNIADSGDILAKWRAKYDIPMLGPDWSDLVAKWLKYRAEIRRTYRGCNSIKRWLNQLYRLSAQDITTATAIVNQSIDNEWEGIFELKTKKHNGTQFRQDSGTVHLPTGTEGGKFKDTI